MIGREGGDEDDDDDDDYSLWEQATNVPAAKINIILTRTEIRKRSKEQ